MWSGNLRLPREIKLVGRPYTQKGPSGMGDFEGTHFTRGPKKKEEDNLQPEETPTRKKA